MGGKARGGDGAGRAQRAERAGVTQDTRREAAPQLAQLAGPGRVVEQRPAVGVEQVEMHVHAVARFGGVQQRREAGA